MLLSINQIAQLFEAVYDTIHTTIREVEAALKGSFHLVWSRIQDTIDDSTQIYETDQKCSGLKRQTPPRDSLSRSGSGEPRRSRCEGAPGDTVTLARACRDTLRVIHAEHGAKPDELRRTLNEIEILSEKIDGLWHDGWR